MNHFILVLFVLVVRNCDANLSYGDKCINCPVIKDFDSRKVNKTILFSSLIFNFVYFLLNLSSWVLGTKQNDYQMCFKE